MRKTLEDLYAIMIKATLNTTSIPNLNLLFFILVDNQQILHERDNIEKHVHVHKSEETFFGFNFAKSVTLILLIVN